VSRYPKGSADGAEVLCDECETALKFEEFEDTLRKEVC